MGWVFGALILTIAVAMVIAGTSGTAPQVWQIVSGHGVKGASTDSSSSSSSGGIGGAVGGALTPDQLNHIFGSAYNYPHSTAS